MNSARRLLGIVHTTQPQQLAVGPRPPSEFADFDDLLEKDERSTPGFEIFSSINVFEIKKRDHTGREDFWENSWRYDIVGDKRQSLFLAIKEFQFYSQYNCFSPTKSPVLVSAFTDLYQEPVFICSINNQNCRITTANPRMLIGSIGVTKGSILLTNEEEGLTFTVVTNLEESQGPTRVYEVWEGESRFLGSVTWRERHHWTLFTIDSLSPSSKVLFFGLAFYLSP